MTSVLFVRLSAMGDLVQGLGAMQSLHRVRPDWRLTVVTQTANVPLLDNVAAVESVVGFDRGGGWRAVLALRRELRRRHFDVAVDLQGNWKSAFVAWISGARDTLGAGAAWRRESASRCLLRRTVAIQGRPHPARVAWALVRALAPGAPFAWPRLVASPAEITDAAKTLRGLGLDTTRPFRIVVVTDPSDPRALRSPQIAAELDRAGAQGLALAGPAVSELDLPAGTRVLRQQAGQLRHLVGLGALAARVGAVVVGPDQGATHVLAAAGVRCEVLFGAQDPRATAPPAARVWMHPEGPACRPCSSRTCKHPDGPVCMAFDPATGVAGDAQLPREGGEVDPGA